MNNNKEKVKSTFNNISEKFDEIGTPFFSLFGKIVCDYADIKSRDIILDIACGKGAVTFPVSEKIKSGQVTGIDISDKMIAACNDILGKNKKSNVEFKVMDAENLEFDNETFDKVLCGFGLFFLPDIEKGISEIKRVLKKDGILVFSSWNKEYQLSWVYDLLSEYIPELKKVDQPKPDKIDVIDFRTIPGIEKILNLSGLKKVEIITENIDCYYKDGNEWFNSRWSTGNRMFLEKLSASQYTDLKEKTIKKLNEYMEDNKIKTLMSAFITKALKS